MSQKIIYGIQQIGVGVPDAMAGFRWYGLMLGSDVKVFDDNNVATYMAPYMGGEPHRKHAVLAANLQGGSCYEIWQYMDRIPQPPAEKVSIGDLGIHAVKIKASNIDEAFGSLKTRGVTMVGEISRPAGQAPFFFIEDLYGNILQVVESDNWFKQRKGRATGGACGCIIGVSDIDKARQLYSGVLGYDRVLADETAVFPDLAALKGGDRRFRRVLLTHSAERSGGMASLLGRSQIELLQWLDGTAPRIFANRYWGDMGFIHLCFDIHNMEALKADCAAAGFPFTVESDPAFEMGDAAGSWGYLEDPDGTLIEFVETKKIPIVKKWGWFLHLDRRDPHKSLPRWMISALGMNRVKFK